MIAAPMSVCRLRDVAEDDVAEEECPHDQCVLIGHDGRGRREAQRLVDEDDRHDGDGAELHEKQKIHRADRRPCEGRRDRPENHGAGGLCRRRAPRSKSFFTWRVTIIRMA